MKHFFRLLALLITLSMGACAQVGYVPLTDVTIDQEVQKNHRESKKFLSKNVRATNSQLPKGDHFMVKGLRKKPSRLPSGEKFQTIKDRSSAAHRKKYKNPKKPKGIR